MKWHCIFIKLLKTVGEKECPLKKYLSSSLLIKLVRVSTLNTMEITTNFRNQSYLNVGAKFSL